MTRSGEVPAHGAEQTNPGSTGNDAGSGGERDLAGFDRAIHELHGRIADLRVSVGDLGHPDAHATPPPPAYEPPAAYPEPPPAFAPAPPPPTYEAPPPQYAPQPPYEPPPAAYEPPPPQAYYEYEQPVYEQQAPYAEPQPAGAYAPEGSEAVGTFSRVDIGPFEDLLAMTAFEEQLSALPSMADVRVRRFGHGRAEIELETVGVVPVAREVLRIAPDAQAQVAEDGTLSVELFSEQWTGPRTQEAEQDLEGAVAPEPPEHERGETHG